MTLTNWKKKFSELI
jgi:hypothetical protein